MTTTTQPLDLEVFCSQDRPTIAKPFSEGQWTYYTNGAIIVRSPRDPNVPEREDAPKNLEKHIFIEAKPVFTKPLAELEIPDLEGPQTCGNCEGSGMCGCTCGTDHECGICKGTGKTPEEPEGVDFGRHLLNHLLLHKLKRHLTNVLLLEYDEDPLSTVGFYFDGGDGRLAPMKQP